MSNLHKQCKRTVLLVAMAVQSTVKFGRVVRDNDPDAFLGIFD